jgi:DNA-binding NarL/FixJ family response regulator
MLVTGSTGGPRMSRTRVFVHGNDLVTEAGLACLLRAERSLHVLAVGEIDSAGIAVLGARNFAEAHPYLAGIQRGGMPPVILVLEEVDGHDIVEAAAAGVRGVLRRTGASTAALTSAIDRVLRGLAVVPDDLVGALLDQAVSQPESADRAVLTQRERAVIALLADGATTYEIGDTLGYSERTVKGVIHDITTRLQLRNRPHAVAFALRNGMI